MVQYKIWNIDIPSTWLGLKGISFTMTPRLLLEVLYGYQANVMPHSVVPDVIYSAACNPSSVLLTSSLVDIRSPVGSAKMQGQILGKVGDILTSPSQVPVLGINEADSMNESIFAGWKQLNILGNTTGRHFVLVFLTSPERPSSPVSSMNHRWMPFRSYWDPSSILPPGRMHLVSSASYPVLPAHMDPIPSISCPAPPAHMNLIPSISYPAPPARTDLIPSVSYPAPPAHTDSIPSVSYPAPLACTDPIPAQLVPSVFHPGPAVISPSFISPGVQKGKVFYSNARDFSHLCSLFGLDATTLKYQSYPPNTSIIVQFQQYAATCCFELQLGCSSNGVSERKKHFVQYNDQDKTMKSVYQIIENDINFKSTTYDDKRRLFTFTQNIGLSDKIWRPANVPKDGFQKRSVLHFNIYTNTDCLLLVLFRPYDVWTCVKYLWGPAGPLTLNRSLPTSKNAVLETSLKLSQSCLKQYQGVIQSSLINP